MILQHLDYLFAAVSPPSHTPDIPQETAEPVRMDVEEDQPESH